MTAEEPPGGAPSLELSPPERALLKALKAERAHPLEEESLSEALGIPEDTVRGSLQRLRSKHLADALEERVEHRTLTARGRETLRKGLPERRLLTLLGAHPDGLAPERLPEEGFDEEERSAAIGRLRRLGLLLEGVPLRVREGHSVETVRIPEETVLRQVHDEIEVGDAAAFAALKKRGLVALEVEILRRWRASAEGIALPLSDEAVPSLGALTPEMMRTGSWRTAGFRPYDVRAVVPYLGNPRPHPYAAWLREFEEILVGLGFTQSEGPLLETEFWNNDVLFMPQEHPARSIHDVLSPAGVDGQAPPEPLGGRVARAHEGRPMEDGGTPVSIGWRYPYDPGMARRPVLRSQTTAVSARFMARRPSPPFRMYCVDRNFRKDAVDASHLVEFHQCEGILGGEGVNLRDLVGVFQALAEAIGIREIKIRPSYFPFTEPSLEGYVKHPRLGWIEAMPGGLFRPEVLQPLGIEVPVAAWGIGVARLAMVALGISDIRELYDDDLERLTAREA